MSIGDIEILDAVPGHGGRRAGAGGRKAADYADVVDLFADDGVETKKSLHTQAAEAKIRKEVALADQHELNYKIKSGLYVERAAVQEVCATLLAALAQALRSLPDNLERKFNMPPDQVAEVTEVIDATLSDIADGMAIFSDVA
jgi:phage terminase Nu1 subunit (DNA packaging protein)